MIQIRVAHRTDAPFIARLGRTTFSETFAHLFQDPEDLQHYLNTTFAVEKINNSLIKPNNTYWIAFFNDLPVGYAKLKLQSECKFIDSKNIGQLQKIYVLKDFLSMKIGKKLQDKLLLEAKAHGAEQLWLSVLETNERAIRFYKKNLFHIVGGHTFTIGKQHFEFLAMSKHL